MSVDLYTLCWNEVDMLGFFFRHYDPWVDRYFIYDDGSTDGSLDVLSSHPRVEVRRFQRANTASFVLSHQVFHNEVWKESRGRADWVVITALDEHLVVKGHSIADYLRECTDRGTTLVPSVGYQMISDDFPEPDEWLCHTRSSGAPYSMMNKMSIFNPDAVVETGFAVGRHTAEPIGNLHLPLRDELMLLHYKYLNFDRTLERHHAQSAGLGETDRLNRWAVQYDWSATQLRDEWTAFQARAVDVGTPDFEPWQTYAPPRWWRSEPADVTARLVDVGPQTLAALRDADIRRLHGEIETQRTLNRRLRDEAAERDLELARLRGLLDKRRRWVWPRPRA